MKSFAGSLVPCTSSPPGESNNISNALAICSGRTVSGQVNEFTDRDDVYKISVNSGQRLTILMNGTGDDADLFLYSPDATDVHTDARIATSEDTGNNESINIVVFTSGFWYVDVYSYSGTSNYNLTASISSP